MLLVHPATGEKLRTIGVGTAIRSQPIVQNGWVYVGGEDGTLVGVDTGDRTLDGWTHWGGDAKRNNRASGRA